MILSDSEIRARLESGSLVLETSEEYDVFSQIWPASLDFRLSDTFRYYKRDCLTLIDPRKWIDPEHIKTVKLDKDTPFILHPWQFILGATIEKMKLPSDLLARCEWRSSLGRLGIIIHSTAGFIDPWFEGTITLEITNINEVPIALYPGMRIGQFAFQTMLWEVAVPYDKRTGSKYMGQINPEVSKISKDLENKSE